MPVTVVVGAQWGDEGKAKVIDLLSKEHGYVVRYQGGHNAGHTVVVGDERYALQLIPSGILYDHVVPVIANGVVVDMPTLFAEIDTLERRGVSCDRLVVSSHAHLIFPWHQAWDALCRAGPRRRQDRHDAEGHRPCVRRQGPPRGHPGGRRARPGSASPRRSRSEPPSRTRRIVAAGGTALDVDAHRRAVRRAGCPLWLPYVGDTVSLLHDALRSRPARAARGRAGDVPRPRPRHVSVRHVVEPHGGRRVRRHRARARATSTASSASPRRTPPVSAPVRSRPSCSTPTVTGWSRSAASSAPSPAAVAGRAGSTASCCARPCG